MNIKLKWHKFLCWLFDHRWNYITILEEDTKRASGEIEMPWYVCRRCAEAQRVQARLPARPAIRRWLYACAIVFLIAGYFLGIASQSQDLPRVELAQAEIRRELKKLAQEKELAEMVEKLLQEYRDVIDWNREHYDD